MSALEDFIKIKITKAVTMPDENLIQVYRNKYWSTDGEHIFFYRDFHHPQCNSTEKIAMSIGGKRGWTTIFLAAVFVTHNCQDFT